MDDHIIKNNLRHIESCAVTITDQSLHLLLEIQLKMLQEMKEMNTKLDEVTRAVYYSRPVV